MTPILPIATGAPFFSRDDLMAWLDRQGFPVDSRIKRVAIEINPDDYPVGAIVTIECWLKNADGDRHIGGRYGTHALVAQGAVSLRMAWSECESS